jgi:hypothetical protein
MKQSAAAPGAQPSEVGTKQESAGKTTRKTAPAASYKPALDAYASAIVALASAMDHPGADEPNLPTDTRAERQRKDRIANRNQAARMALARLEELKAAIKDGNDITVMVKAQAVMDWLISYEKDMRPGTGQR